MCKELVPGKLTIVLSEHFYYHIQDFVGEWNCFLNKCNK